MNKLIEKIVELIEKHRDIAEAEYHEYLDNENNYPCIFNDADLAETRYKILCEIIIDIHEEAKAYNEEVCEWKQTGKVAWTPSCEPNVVYGVTGVDWFRRCPYCGKKIKVLG